MKQYRELRGHKSPLLSIHTHSSSQTLRLSDCCLPGWLFTQHIDLHFAAHSSVYYQPSQTGLNLLFPLTHANREPLLSIRLPRLPQMTRQCGRLLAGWPSGLLTAARPSCCGQIWAYCVFGGIWKSSKLWLKITAVCHDMLMSDLGILLCGTDAKLYKLINKTNIAALGKVLMEKCTRFMSPIEAGLQQKGASYQQQMSCRFTVFGQMKLWCQVWTLAGSLLRTQRIVDHNRQLWQRRVSQSNLSMRCSWKLWKANKGVGMLQTKCLSCCPLPSHLSDVRVGGELTDFSVKFFSFYTQRPLSLVQPRATPWMPPLSPFVRSFHHTIRKRPFRDQYFLY